MARRIVALAAATGLVLAAGCELGGDRSLSQEEVETWVRDDLAQQFPELEPPDIECPGDLTAEVGEEMECVLSVEGDPERYPVQVVVTDTDDDGAHLDFQVGEEPL